MELQKSHCKMLASKETYMQLKRTCSMSSCVSSLTFARLPFLKSPLKIIRIRLVGCSTLIVKPAPDHLELPTLLITVFG